jgi:hypothetical protein
MDPDISKLPEINSFEKTVAEMETLLANIKIESDLLLNNIDEVLYSKPKFENRIRRKVLFKSIDIVYIFLEKLETSKCVTWVKDIVKKK